jgi:mRNA-degrading endonuclease RelE of RelBE toxin-antitoxin system
MQVLIADTFTDSLARLTGEEQKAVKTTAFDLQLSPASPGMQFHKLDRARDKGFWSVRVSADIRLIVHRSKSSLLLCYVDHHDKAYAWAEKRRLETHPRTGAAQLVEIRETVKEIVVPVHVPAQAAAGTAPTSTPRRLFSGLPDDELLGYGVPADWIHDVRNATEATLTSRRRRRRRSWSSRLAARPVFRRPAPRRQPSGRTWSRPRCAWNRRPCLGRSRQILSSTPMRSADSA